MKLLVLSMVLALWTGVANATEEQFDTIQAVEMYELVTDENGDTQEVLIQSDSQSDFFNALAKAQKVQRVDIDGYLMMTRKLIALGKEIYNIVKAGKPVVTVNSEPVQVLPLNEEGEVLSSVSLAGWKPPKVKKYKIAAKNYLGISPVSFEFMVIFSYGGSNNGAGAYLTGAEIKPLAVDVKWGYSFNADFKLQTIVNEGSLEDPIAGAVLMMDSKISTTLQESHLNKTFYINGLGTLNAY